MMKAVRVSKQGSSTTLNVEEVPKPSIKQGELLVKIRASFLQPADFLNSKGGFAITTFPRTIGRDFAGIVVEGSDEWKGKDVYGTSGSTFSFTEDGGQAEYAVLRESTVAPKPRSLSFPQAAAVGTPVTTALTTLVRARTKPNDVVMVLGASGNVGSFVIQIAKVMGCKTIGVGHQGADINSLEDPTLSGSKKLTGGNGPDVVVDTIGDLQLLRAAFDVTAANGRISIISAPRQGNRELPVDLLSLYRRQIDLIGCNSVAASQNEMVQLLKDLAPDFESGQLIAPEDKTMNLIGIEQAPDAYSGKIKRAVIVFD